MVLTLTVLAIRCEFFRVLPVITILRVISMRVCTYVSDLTFSYAAFNPNYLLLYLDYLRVMFVRYSI